MSSTSLISLLFTLILSFSLQISSSSDLLHSRLIYFITVSLNILVTSSVTQTYKEERGLYVPPKFKHRERKKDEIEMVLRGAASLLDFLPPLFRT